MEVKKLRAEYVVRGVVGNGPVVGYPSSSTSGRGGSSGGGGDGGGGGDCSVGERRCLRIGGG